MGPETSAGTDEENGSPSRGAVRASFPRKVGYTGHETMLSACTARMGPRCGANVSEKSFRVAHRNHSSLISTDNSSKRGVGAQLD